MLSLHKEHLASSPLIRKALPPGRFQMSIFEGRNTVFTLLVVINQAQASLAEDGHPNFFK
jgi:hypothetical protein